VELVNAGEGGALLSRLKLEGAGTAADLVVGGIDAGTQEKFKRETGWKSEFAAFDRGPYAFIYNSQRLQTPPHSLDDLLEPRFKNQILLEDPRTSTTGLGFLLWVVKEKGESTWKYLEQLKPQIKAVTPGWDLAYGLFKKNQALLVFSYWSSPAYHIQEEKTDIYRAAEFTGGHYVQTEYLIVNPASKNAELAGRFKDFMLSDEAQEKMPEKNFMFPARSTVKLTPAFEKIGRPKKELAPLSASEIDRSLGTWLKKWQEIFKK
jgi:thiamine transport system substrate-binding protein